MKAGLGIDTGGTYTDSVLLDFETGKVVRKAKALTTRHDLSIGILDSIEALGDIPSDFIKLVSLSTTLATNSIVEGRGGKVCLIGIGYNPKLLYEGLGDSFPVREIHIIRGGHDIYGVEREPLDLEAAYRVILKTRDSVEAYAVSGYGAVRNPEHEIKVKELIRSLCDLPVVCGHELSDRLNSIKRAVTAAFNARLIPLIRELILSVERALKAKGIDAPIMVVKGDGHMMSNRMAVERPIETILSGPAASVMGGRFLSGCRDGIVVDMGGTTTDIAVLYDGSPRLSGEGARVGGWQTSVLAADIQTTGIGGDSHIRLDPRLGFTISPRRVVPLSLLSSRHPEIKKELLRIGSSKREPVFTYQPSDFLILSRSDGRSGRPEVISQLRGGPKSIDQLARAIGTHPVLLNLSDLEESGVVMRSGLTPTDVLHYRGMYLKWDREAAEIGVRLYSRWLGISPDKFADGVLEAVERKVAREIAGKIISDESGIAPHPGCRLCDWIWREMLGLDDKKGFTLSAKLSPPIIAIGAPVEAYMPNVARRLNAKLIIPPHAEVANAVGAITGGIAQTATARIEPIYTPAGVAGYTIHAPSGRFEAEKMSEALRIAEREASNEAERLARMAGASEVEIEVEKLDMETAVPIDMGGKVLLEICVRATAYGRMEGIKL